MVKVGQYYIVDIMQDWFLKKGLPEARKVLSQFNMLNKLFSSFKNYEKKKCKETKNIVLLKCLPNITTNVTDTENIEQLRELEEALSIFGVLNWQKDKMNHLKNRLCSDDYYVSLSVYIEIIVAKRLVDKFGKNKVTIHPKLTTG